jgi:hypothetical protein
MILPINVMPPHVYQVDAPQANKKNINAHLQQFELSSAAVQSSDLSAPLSLDDTSVPDTAVQSSNLAAPSLDESSVTGTVLPSSLLAETATADHSINTLFDKSVAPEQRISLAQKKKRIVAPAPPRDPAPLPPPSQVTPPPPPPPLTSPLPSGPPPVEPGNYPNPQSQSTYYNQNYIGPAIAFGNGVQIGAVSRFGIGKNLSVRPSLLLGNFPQFSVPITYDFGFNDNEQFEKNPLVILHAGGGLSYRSITGGSSLNPLIVFGADVYLGDGASVLLQLSNTFNSDFTGIIGVGLQF